MISFWIRTVKTYVFFWGCAAIAVLFIPYTINKPENQLRK
jgi:hypothetical protein